MLNWWKKHPFLSPAQADALVQVLQEQEQHTSGEIRLFMERHCAYMNPMDRARDVFYALQMHKTRHRNAVLIYIAYLDQDFALLADQGIFTKVAPAFWKEQIRLLHRAFSQRQHEEGIRQCIIHTGEELKRYYPPEAGKQNELDDEIVWGR